MGLREECLDTTATGIGEPVTRAPCAADDPCIEFTQDETTDYKPKWSLKAGCLRAVLGICNALGTYAPISTADPLLSSSTLRWVTNPETGVDCLGTLPATFAETTCSQEVANCEGFVGEGAIGDVTQSCDTSTCVTWTNDGAWPATVTPKVTSICAAVNGGPARIEFPTTVNGLDTQTLCLVESGIDAASSTYSGTTELRPIIVQPGDTVEFCGAPRAVLTQENETAFSVQWGNYWLCLEASAQVNATTIAAFTSGE